MLNKKAMMVMMALTILLAISPLCAADENATADNLAIDDDAIVLSQENTQSILESSNSPDNFSRIQQAINLAEEGDEIVLNKSYLGNGTQIIVNKTVTIIGDDTTIDANCSSRIFYITAPNVVIRGINFINGNATGGDGGAIWGNSYSVYDCSFRKCTAANGAALYNGYAEHCNFNNGHANEGGATYLTTVVNSYLYFNEAYEGGAVFRGSVANSTLMYNRATYGGAVYQASSSNCLFENNFATDYGGAIYNSYAVLCNFTGNSADYGNAMYSNTALDCLFNSDGCYDTYQKYSSHIHVADISANAGDMVHLNISVTDYWGNPIGGDIYLFVNGVDYNTYFTNYTVVNITSDYAMDKEYTIKYEGSYEESSKTFNINFKATKPASNFEALHEAILKEYSGGTFEVDCDYTYNPTTDSKYAGGITINKNIVVNGYNHVFNGYHLAKFFNVASGYTVTFNDVIFVYGNGGNGGAVSGGIFNNCTFIANSASSSGGAVYGAQTVTSCSFIHNTANVGGALYYGTVDDCYFYENWAWSEGGVGYGITVNNSNMEYNRAFSWDRSYFKGAALSYSSVYNSNFIQNWFSTYKMDISCYGTLYHTPAVNCDFQICYAEYGAVSCYGDLINCTVWSAISWEQGGAVYCANVYNCTLESCSGKDVGGAIYKGNAYNTTFIKCHTNTLSSSDYDACGGGIYQGDAYNCTFIECIAYRGGAIYGGNAYSCVFLRNYATDNGRSLYECGVYDSWYYEISERVGFYDRTEEMYRCSFHIRYYLSAENITGSGNVKFKVRVVDSAGEPMNVGQVSFTYLSKKYSADVVDGWADFNMHVPPYSSDESFILGYNGPNAWVNEVIVHVFNGIESDAKNFIQLYDLINNATENQTIELTDDYEYCAESDSSLSRGIPIKKSITINGNGHIINGFNVARIFDIYSEHDITLYNITFVQSGGIGAIYSSIGNENYLKIINCKFDSCIKAVSAANVINCSFTNCHSTSTGAAVSYGNCENSIFINCSSVNDGGALEMCSAFNCLFINCSSQSGGAIDYGSANLCKFINCSAQSGGACYQTPVSNSVFIGCFAKTGGACYQKSVSNSTFIGCIADDGACLCNVAAYDCNFIDSHAENTGVIYKGSVYNSTFTNCTSYYDVCIYSASSENCTFEGCFDDYAYIVVLEIYGNSFEDIQKVINEARNGNNIHIHGTYLGNGTEITVDKLLNIVGFDAVLDAQDMSRIFSLCAHNISISNITFANGHAEGEGGAILVKSSGSFEWSAERYGGITVSNSTFINCSSTDKGGAARAINAYGSVFIDCHSNAEGGALYQGSAINSRFIGCYADSAGAIYQATAINSTFEDCHSIRGGAARDGSVLNCKFTSCYSTDSGGALYSTSAANCLLDDCYVEGEYASGGAMYGASAVNSTFRNCRVIDSMAYGGATYSTSNENCTFINCSAKWGGAVHGKTAINCYFENCTAKNQYSRGGSIYKASAINCTFKNSYADTYDVMYECKASNCTIYVNSDQTLDDILKGFSQADIFNNFTLIFTYDSKMLLLEKSTYVANGTLNMSVKIVSDSLLSDGHISIYKEGKKVATGKINNGKADIQYVCTHLGEFDMAAKYDENEEVSADFKLKVVEITEIPYNVSISTQVIGNSVNVSVEIPDGEGEAIVFVFNGEDVIKNQTVQINNGIANVLISDLDVGNYTVKAQYGKFESDIEEIEIAEIPIIKIQPNMTVNSTDIIEGAMETITVSFSQNVSGNLTLVIGDNSYVENIIDGMAVIEIYALTANNYSAVVYYEGDENYLPCNESASFRVIPKSNPDLTIEVNNLAQTHESVFTMTFAGDETGTVTLTVNGEDYVLDIVEGKVELKVSDLANGDYPYTIIYSGDDKYNSFESSGILNVNNTEVSGNGTECNETSGNVTDINGTSGNASDINGTSGNVTVVPEVEIPSLDDVSGGDNVLVTLPADATGSVTLTVDGMDYVFDVMDGKAVVKLPELADGDYPYAIAYSGDRKYSSVVSSGVMRVNNGNVSGNETVGNVTDVNGTSGNASDINGTSGNETSGNVTVVPEVEIPSLDDPSDNGTVTVILPADATGTVTLSVDGKDYVFEVVDGKAEVKLPELTNGDYPYVITYSGDSKYSSFTDSGSMGVNNTSVAPVGNETDVNGTGNATGGNATDINGTGNQTGGNTTKIVPEVEIPSLDEPSADGTVTITLPVDATGTVTLTVDGKDYVFEVVNGKVDVKLPELGDGDYPYTIAYSGDGKYSSFTDSGSMGVNNTSVAPVGNETDVNGTGNATGGNATDINGTGNQTGENATKPTPEVVVPPMDGPSVNGTVTITLPADASGTVTLTVDGKDYVFEVVNGKADVKIPELGDGDYPYTITYSGDDKYSSFTDSGSMKVNNTSVAPVGNETDINSTGNATGDNTTKPTPEVEIPSLDEPSADGTVTVTLPADAKGTVTLTVDGKDYVFEVVDGKAEVKLPELANGDYPYTIVYSGDAKYSSFTDSGSMRVNNTSVTPVGNETDVNGTANATEGNGTDVNGTGNATGDNTTKLTPEIEIPSMDEPSAEGTVTVTLPADATGTVTLTVDGKDYVFDVINGKADVKLPELTNGDYPYIITYSGDDKYSSFTDSGSMNVNNTAVTPVGNETDKNTTENNDTNASQKIGFDIEFFDDCHIYGETNIFGFLMPKDIEEIPMVLIDGRQYSCSEPIDILDPYSWVWGGSGEKNGYYVYFSDLSTGNHEVIISYSGDSKYASCSINKTITVYDDAEDNSTKPVPEIVVPPVDEPSENGTVTVTLPGDATGTVTLNVDGKDYVFDVINGKADVKLPEMADGEHNYTITYSGDSKYASFIDSGSMKVNSTSVTPAGNETDVNGTGNQTGENTTKPAPEIEIPSMDEPSTDGTVTISLPADATGTVTLTVDGKDYVFDVVNGKADIKLPELANGDHNYKITYSGDSRYASFTSEGSMNVNKTGESQTENKTNTTTVDKTKITVSNLKVTYAVGKYCTIKVVGADSEAAEGVDVKLSGKISKSLKTNADGIAKFKVTQKPGSYKFTVTALNRTVTKTLTVKHLLTLKTVTVKKSAKKLVLQANLGKVNGKYLKGKTITFKFNGKVVGKVKTNSKGVAKVTVKSSVLKKLKVGKKVTYQATYSKDTVKKTAKIKK